MLNSVGGSKGCWIGTKNGVVLPKEIGWTETDEVGEEGSTVLRTVGKDGKILPEDHPFAWRMEWNLNDCWGVYWQNHTVPSYIKINGDPTNPPTIEYGQGWKTNFGKKPPPRFEDATQQHQVRTPYQLLKREWEGGGSKRVRTFCWCVS